MKQAFFYSLLSMAAVLALTLSPSPAAPAPEPSPTPPGTDQSIVFTVQTDDGVKTVTMADYLPGVVAGEMPALFAPAALQAQAVAGRTYILHRMQRQVAAHPLANVCTSPSCCKAYAAPEQLQSNWGDHYDAYSEKIGAAVSSTDGQVLLYEGALIEAVFHASSAGATEASGNIWNSRPYLVSVDSPESAEEVPNYTTTVTFTPRELQAELPQVVFSHDPAQWVSKVELNDSGRVQTISLGDQKFTGAQLRSALGLRSAAFTVAYENGSFVFTVTGHGHGVGMSQYGANIYAKQGWGYGEILAHYYPGTMLDQWSSNE